MTSPYSFHLFLPTPSPTFPNTPDSPTISTIPTSDNTSAPPTDMLSLFWSNHNQTANNNTIILSSQTIKKMLQYPTITILLYNFDQLIGSIVTPIIPIRYKNITHLYGCVTFLCLHSAYRSQGLCPLLINKLKETASSLSINRAYYLNKHQTHTTDLPIKTWYRPINFLKARQAGFHIPPTIKSPSLDDIKITKITSDIIDSSYSSLLQLINKNKNKNINIDKESLVFYPTRDQWSSWISSSPSFLVYSTKPDSTNPDSTKPDSTNPKTSKNQLKAIFSKKRVDVRMNCGTVVNLSLLIFSIGEGLAIIKGCLKASTESDLMYGYITGDVTLDKVKRIDGVITKTNVWLSFNLIYWLLDYMDDQKIINEKELYIPLL